MDYCLGSGDGTATMFSGPAAVDVDGDGEIDGVRLDIDGDGVFDDALADFDGDGLADHAALDLDDDGTLMRLYTDDGSGTWALTPAGTGGPLRWIGLDGVEHTSSGAIDFNGDGRPDRLVDVDRDGLADRVLRAGAGGGFDTGYVDTDGDGRWDLILVDADGDGAADDASPV
ncbi:FG-GAP-like repeat-containing protein [Mycolicibacterium sphagni]|uniref:Pullulanase n=1 Tax=Mycolicibacterium sphagni TaxID=1786 RepID=A0ABX2K3K3_9MYCO|nr:FG-GAP-like repeat-containing protein [Mycolicibacterium sphagni]NTY61663.1 pullulanase [Mycolicibacterium sphagni]